MRVREEREEVVEEQLYLDDEGDLRVGRFEPVWKSTSDLGWDNVTSMAWGRRNLISTQARTLAQRGD